MEQVKIPEGAKLFSIERIKPFEKNARTHSESQVEQIASSMLEFGFTNPILIDEKDMIIAGHGRLMAANRLGLKEVPVIILSHLTEDQKRAYCLADNSIALNAGWDEDMLKAELADLKEKNFDLTLTGFSDDELDDFFKEPEPPKPKKSVIKKSQENPVITSAQSKALAGNVEPPSALPKAPLEEIPTHKLKREEHPSEKQPSAKPLPSMKGNPVSRIGDVWLLGKHELKCARVMDLAMDKLVLHWQELTGKDAVLKKTKKSFTDTGIARNKKRA